MRWRGSRRQPDPHRAIGFATPRYIARTADCMSSRRGEKALHFNAILNLCRKLFSDFPPGRKGLQGAEARGK
jgi:hypothetical protein